MAYRVQVGNNYGITLEESVYLVNGFMDFTTLSQEKQESVSIIEGKQSEIILPARETIHLSENPLPLLQSVRIIGNYATVVGTWNIGFIMMSDDTVIQDIVMDSFSTAIMINGHGKTIENMQILNCRFRRFTGCCIMTGSDLSNSCIRRVTISQCKLEGAPENESGLLADWFNAPVGVMITAASGLDQENICNCTTEHILIENCTFRGRHRNGVNVLPAALAGDPETGKTVHYAYDCTVRDIKICNSNFTNAYDSTLNFMGSYMHNVHPLLENIEICDCYVEYNIWGIWLGSTEPCQEMVSGAIVRNINVHHNELRLKAGGSGEDSTAFAIQCGRLDYADGAKANNGLVESVRFTNNIIHHTQHGVFLNAADSMVDGMDTEMIGNVIRNVEILHNAMYDVDDCFTFYGARLEGRRVDIRIGVPPKNQTWLPLLKDHSVVTCVAKDNIIEDVICRDNFCTGYKFMYKIAGVKAFGHAYAENNHVAQNVVIENNTFEEGEGHILVEDQVICDWVCAENNSAPKRYKGQ